MSLTSRVIVLLAGCAGIVGCAEEVPPHIETVFDPCSPLAVVADGDDNEMASVATGLDIWNGGAGTRLEFISSPGGDETEGAAVGAAVPAAELPIRFDTAGAAFHGYYDDVAGVVFINDDITSDSVRAITVAHELGHAFGLFHVPKETRPSLMNHGNTSIGLTDEDVAALAALWGACPPP